MAALEHVASCVPCKAFRDQCDAFGAALSRPVAAPVPGDLAERIVAAAQAGQAGGRAARFPRWLAPTAAAAAVVVAALSWRPGEGAGPPAEAGGSAVADGTVAPGDQLPSGFDVPFDVASLGDALSSRMAMDLADDPIAEDVGKVREFFGSRLRALPSRGFGLVGP